MVSARKFEQAIIATTTGSPLFGAAGSLKSKRVKAQPPQAIPSDEEIEAALAAAATRLKEHPELLSGDPNGVFTYEDPVLAEALYWLRKSVDSNRTLFGAAGKLSGEKLKEGWYRPAWIKT